MQFKRPTRAIIDLDSLAFNLNSVRRFIGKEIRVMAMVKANAYGHGSRRCAKRLESEGADWFGVATTEEAVELRANGIRKPILSLGGPWPGEEEIIFRDEITPAIFDLQTASRIDRIAETKGIRKKIHIKIDTGMGRVGVPYRDVSEFINGISSLRFLEIEGAMTHFAAADDLGENQFTSIQVDRFNSAVLTLRERGFDPEIIDLSNSPGAVVHPDAGGNMVRLGGVLYGLVGDILPANIERPEFRPVMSIVSALAMVKRVRAGETLGYSRTFTTKHDCLIGTVPIGYHDGFPRGLSNQGAMIVNRVVVPVVGRVSMDWTIVDLTDAGNAEVGDEVVIIGTEGEASVTSEDVARRLGTISYEITCGISSRVPRVFRGGKQLESQPTE